MSKIDTPSNLGGRRNRWLIGGSSLAAAAALTLTPGQGLAQSRTEVMPRQVVTSPSSLDSAIVPTGIIRDAPVVAPRQPTAGTAPTAGAYTSLGGDSHISSITAFSSTTAPSNGDTNTAGINVAASANYFAAEVDYRPGTGLDVVELLASSAIINWTTNAAGTAGGEVTFLGAGQQLNFTSALGDYTVLNRIFTPTVDAAVRIDGTVASNTFSGSGTGGNIWFYSPGGLIIGASSVFNVGSLVLTSSNLNAIGTTMNFTGVAEANTAVVIESGAQISALGPNSYLAVVAPRVEQGGSVNVNGSVAYVGAEQAQLTINGGLFDISVGLGSADANGVVHTGTTTGPASSPILGDVGEIVDADARGIHMVAVPKNTAISMLVGGTVGYQPAAAASLGDNGSIILSAGAGIMATGDATNAAAQVDTANAVAGGNVVLDAVTFTSSADVYASDSVTLAPSGTNSILSGSDGRGGYDLDVTAGGNITMALTDAAVIDVSGNLTLSSGGDIAIDLTSASGAMTVGGNFTVETFTQGADDFSTFRDNGGTGIGADAVSGAITLTVGGGTSLDVGGNLLINSAAQGGKGEVQNGSATAGDIAVDFGTTGPVNIGGALAISAQAISAQTGKEVGNGPGGVGSDSTAGDVTLNLGSSSFSAGGLFVNTSAEASAGDDPLTAQSNDAAAGDITVNVTAGTNQIGNLDLFSRSDGALSFDGSGNEISGQAGRGTVSLNVTNPDTLLGVAGNAFVDASTNGVVAAPTGNTVSVTVDNVGPEGGLLIVGSLIIDTTSGGGADTGVTQAGSVLLQAVEGRISADFLDILARASEPGRSFSFTGTGQDFRGGDITLRAGTNGAMDFRFAFIDSEATGALLTAGDAIGGSITLEANDGTIAFQSFATLDASARGGSGSDPVDGGAAMAQGGEITLSLSGASGSLSLGSIFIDADAFILFDVESGSTDFIGDGGTAVAGDVIFNLDGGNLTANSLSISSSGYGGIGGGLPPGITALSTGLPSAGDGGLGQGGNILFNLDGTAMVVGSLDILADGLGGDGAFGDFEIGTRGGRGGDAVGGTVVFNALSGSLTAQTITVAARGNDVEGGGTGGSAAGSEGGNGGNATGGSATFNLDGTAVIDAGSIVVSADGYGGRGGSSFAFFTQTQAGIPGQDGGAGGDGTGGTAIFNNVSGDLSFSSLTASAQGVGGDGGGSSGFSMGDATGAGGAGGAGTGGFATINLDQDDASGLTYSVIADGSGGAGGGGLDSGNGGSATGGTATLAINNSVISLGTATISASAAGGNAGSSDTAGGIAGFGGDAVGGAANLEVNGALASVSTSEPLQIAANAVGGSGADGAPSGTVGNGGDGGAGGSASGGTARIGVSGAGASLTVDPGLAALSADAVGGQGGRGGQSFDAIGGTGGQGGDAVGGVLMLEASSGTTLALSNASGVYVMTSTGTGGAGGQGGDGGFSAASAAGTGGNGGSGTGGSPTLRAVGGTITGSGVVMSGLGIGGDGGLGGTFASGIPGISGNGGAAQGGSPVIELLDGSPGIITLGDVTIISNAVGGTGTVNGTTVGGRIDIRDLSSDAGGVFSFASLSATVLGDTASAGGGFFLTGGSEANTIAGNQTVNVVGDISYAFAGDGQLVVGGTTNLAATGSILVTHTGNTGVVSLSSGGDFTASAGLDFIADGQSVIGSGGAVAIRAESEAEANDLRALSNISLSAGGSVTVNNASVTGPAQTFAVGAGTFVLNGITIRAGVNANQSLEQFDPNFDATITGNVTSTGFVSVTAGGNALFAAGSNTVSDNGLTVRTGDDIIIASGAVVEAGANPATTPNAASPFANFNNLVLDAGALARSGELLSPPLTPLASIVSAGTIEANDFAIILNANAIDGTGGSISAASLAADIVDAPDAGAAQGDDAGLLGGQCLQGNICLGSVSADNRIEIGQNSNNNVIGLVVEQASISANDVLITIRNDIVMGSDGIPTTIQAANTFFAESLTGDINLLGAVINSDQITISAAGSLLGTGSLTSVNDMGITVGQDLNALLIDTGGQLTTAAGVGGAPEAEYSVAGSINVGTYNQGAAAPLRVVAGAGNSFGAISVAGAQDITLIAGNTGPGDVFLGTASGAGSIFLGGDNVGFGTLAGAGDIIAVASGSVTGTSLTAGGTIDVFGPAGITIGSLTGSSALLQAAAGAVAITGDIDLTGLLDAAGRSVLLRSTNDLTVRAAATAGDIDIVTAGDLDLRGIEATGDILLTSSGGSIFVNEPVANNVGLLPQGAQGPLTVISSGGDVVISAADGFTVNAVVSAANALTIEVGRLIDLQAAASGTTIGVVAGDLNIGTAGSLGRSDATTAITIGTAGDIVLGGDPGSPATGVMGIDNGEFTRIFSGGDLSISAAIGPQGAGGNITVDTLDVLVGSGAGTPQDGNIGPAGTLSLSATGVIDIIGTATMTNAGADSRFALDAGQSIDVDTIGGA
ncbi:hypothetical protein, partial [Allopontixanthobacter sp.]|uniref:hypothetical protein n=1 Tax=Allopontixanthobacter sp. TaxID=2906452 RepID=UPI002AB895B6